MYLIEFKSADSWEDSTVINLEEIAGIITLHKSRDLGGYSVVILKSGEKLAISGSVSETLTRILEMEKRLGL